MPPDSHITTCSQLQKLRRRMFMCALLIYVVVSTYLLMAMVYRPLLFYVSHYSMSVELVSGGGGGRY